MIWGGGWLFLDPEQNAGSHLLRSWRGKDVVRSCSDYATGCAKAVALVSLESLLSLKVFRVVVQSVAEMDGSFTQRRDVATGEAVGTEGEWIWGLRATRSEFGHPELVEGSVQLQFFTMGEFYVYVLSNNSQVLYIGVTSNLDGRVFEHVRDRQPSSFTARYNLDRLVFYEVYPTPAEAIAREKQLKGWRRERKKWLIQEMNPLWRNLLDDLKAGMIDLPGDGR